MLRPHRSIFATIAVVATSAWITVAQAQSPNPVYPPGLEAQVAELVFRGDDAPLTPTLEVVGARIEGDRIEIQLGRDSAPVARVLLTHPDAEVPATRLGTTRSFAVWLAEGAEQEDVRPAAEALLARVLARDEGQLANAAAAPITESAPGITTPPQSATSARFGGPRRVVSWLLLLLLLGFLLHRERGRALPPSTRERLTVFGLFALALSLRLALPAWAPLHSNEHGIAELRGMSLLDHGPFGFEATPYGGAYAELVRTLVVSLPHAADAALALGALFGALAVVLLHRVVAQLAPGPFAPALAALALALHPTHVRLSLSESPRPLAGSLLLLGLLAGLLARRSSTVASRGAGLLAACVAWSLASELRVLTLATPLVGLLFVGLARPEGKDTAAKETGGNEFLNPTVVSALVLGAGLLLFTAASHLEALQTVLARAADRPSVDLFHRFVDAESNVLLDPELSAIALLPLAALGAGLLVRSGRTRTVIACVLGVAVLFPPSLLVNACRTDAIRYQSEAHLFLFVLLAGLAPRLLPEAARERARPAWLVVAGLVVLASMPGLFALRRSDVHAQATRVVRRDAPPPSTSIRVPPREMPTNRIVRSDFPEYLVDAPERVERVLPDDLDRPSTTGACVVWIGPPCWSFTRDELERGTPVEIGGEPFREECATLLGGVEAATRSLGRLSALDVPHRAREFHQIPAEHPRVGFAPCRLP